MAKTSKSQIMANAKYDAANTKTVQLKLNKNTDADILDLLNSLANKQGYIKELIRADMAGEKKSRNFKKTATRAKREEFAQWFNLRCKFAMDAGFNSMYYFERDQLRDKYEAEYIKQESKADKQVVLDECEKELIKLKTHWKDVEPDDPEEWDEDEGYTDGFDHPFDDELKVNNLW